MAIGSVVMWVGVPLGLVYLASKLADTANPSMGPYLLIIVGLPVGMRGRTSAAVRGGLTSLCGTKGATRVAERSIRPPAMPKSVNRAPGRRPTPGAESPPCT